ncbi:MAG: sporulation transcription factor Spo0A [Bacillota bacterium]
MQKIRVLIADNNRDLCAALAEHIELQQDMELAGVAYDGLEALEKIRESHPDVIILDITMPYLDGIGVLEQMPTFEDGTYPRVIVLTAFEQENMIQRLISLGADYYMVKPFDMNTLFERLRQFSRKSQSALPQSREHSAEYISAPKAARSKSGSSPTDIELEITRVFHEMGIPAHFRGYVYLREAILMSVHDVELLGNITKNLYPKIAEKYKSTPSGVESAIRHTIEVVWQRGNIDYICDFFGYSDGCKSRFPTTASFIAKVTDKIRLETRVVS